MEILYIWKFSKMGKEFEIVKFRCSIEVLLSAKYCMVIESKHKNIGTLTDIQKRRKKKKQQKNVCKQYDCMAAMMFSPVLLYLHIHNVTSTNCTYELYTCVYGNNDKTMK